MYKQVKGELIHVERVPEVQVLFVFCIDNVLTFLFCCYLLNCQNLDGHETLKLQDYVHKLSKKDIKYESQGEVRKEPSNQQA